MICLTASLYRPVSFVTSHNDSSPISDNQPNNRPNADLDRLTVYRSLLQQIKPRPVSETSRLIVFMTRDIPESEHERVDQSVCG
jgi:hypothetical protein